MFEKFGRAWAMEYIDRVPTFGMVTYQVALPARTDTCAFPGCTIKRPGDSLFCEAHQDDGEYLP